MRLKKRQQSWKALIALERRTGCWARKFKSAHGAREKVNRSWTDSFPSPRFIRPTAEEASEVTAMTLSASDGVLLAGHVDGSITVWSTASLNTPLLVWGRGEHEGRRLNLCWMIKLAKNSVFHSFARLFFVPRCVIGSRIRGAKVTHLAFLTIPTDMPDVVYVWCCLQSRCVAWVGEKKRGLCIFPGCRLVRFFVFSFPCLPFPRSYLPTSPQ